MAYYFEHPALKLPDDNCAISRYMDFPKFESMLKRGSIFFSRADKQTDKFEGEYPSGMLAELERIWGILPSDDGASYTFLQWHKQKEIPSRLLSCWRVGLSKSRKIWSAYTESIESVAIQSTVKKIKNCFGRRENGGPVVWIGEIRYGEKENRLPNSFHKWNVNYFLYPFFAKKEKYRCEEEVRATVNISRNKQSNLNHTPDGCFIKANLHVLIDSVHLHPDATEDFRYKVESMLIYFNYSNIPILPPS
ncbi:MAG: hypothetical protein GY864_12355 [Desulfobacterales bacterium]|nr:hypothetical protein [Desulfobacterales bacterium]